MIHIAVPQCGQVVFSDALDRHTREPEASILFETGSVVGLKNSTDGGALPRIEGINPRIFT